jgi:hypothetical protein
MASITQALNISVQIRNGKWEIMHWLGFADYL